MLPPDDATKPRAPRLISPRAAKGIAAKADRIPAPPRPPRRPPMGKLPPDPPRPPAKTKPPHVPTEATRLVVQVGAAHRTPFDILAKQLGISLPTLRDHYAEELATGPEIVKMRLEMQVVRRALRGSDAMTRYWLQCWGGPGWKPVEHRTYEGRLTFTGSTDELDRAISELERAAAIGIAGRARSEILPS
jgi:hypothetical protein